MHKRFATLALAAVIGGASLTAGGSAKAEDENFVTHTVMTVELALKAAEAALQSCRDSDFQVSVAVVDRFGNTQVMLRDRYAGAHTPAAAEGKAWTAVSFRTNTTELVESTKGESPQAGARDIPGVLMLGGGMKIEKAGSIVGGIGVSGAPGGEQDDACAKAGITAITDALAF